MDLRDAINNPQAFMKQAQDFKANHVTPKIQFFWNGIKVNGGKLQRCYYSDGALVNSPAGTITLYAKDYSGFSAEVAETFTVKNDSDSQTDYFEKDRARVEPSHPLYGQVWKALQLREAHYAKRRM